MKSSLDIYMTDACRRPLLTRDEEVSLSKRIESGDAEARKVMIESNLRLAISIAKKYYRSGCRMEDLIQESNIGLMKAVERFDWRRGFKFSTYASWWIKQSVSRYVSNHKNTVRVPSHMSSLAGKVIRLIKEYEREFGTVPKNVEIADILGVTEKLVESSINTLTFSNLISLDGHVNNDESGRTLNESIEDTLSPNIDEIIDSEKMRNVILASLKKLTKREEQVLRFRFGLDDVEPANTSFDMTKKEIKEILGE